MPGGTSNDNTMAVWLNKFSSTYHISYLIGQTRNNGQGVMNIKYAGVIVTGIVVAIGIVLNLPLYYTNPVDSGVTSSPHKVLLSFSLLNEDNLPKWCMATTR